MPIDVEIARSDIITPDPLSTSAALVGWTRTEGSSAVWVEFVGGECLGGKFAPAIRLQVGETAKAPRINERRVFDLTTASASPDIRYDERFQWRQEQFVSESSLGFPITKDAPPKVHHPRAVPVQSSMPIGQ